MQANLRQQVIHAAQAGDSFDPTERTVWELLKRTGHIAFELFLSLQGSGDLGEQVTTSEDQTLRRSDVPTTTPLRSIFGEHCVEQLRTVRVSIKKTNCVRLCRKLIKSGEP